MKTLKEFLLTEKLSWPKYLKELGIDPNQFKKHPKSDFFKKAYMKSKEALDFEQNYLDELELVSKDVIVK